MDHTKATIATLKRKFTDILGPDTQDICYATQNRQSAVRDLSKLVDVLLVVGAANSSNSNRLREIGAEEGVPSYLIADGKELDPAWVRGVRAVGITAGASAPEVSRRGSDRGFETIWSGGRKGHAGPARKC